MMIRSGLRKLPCLCPRAFLGNAKARQSFLESQYATLIRSHHLLDRASIGLLEPDEISRRYLRNDLLPSLFLFDLRAQVFRSLSLLDIFSSFSLCTTVGQLSVHCSTISMNSCPTCLFCTYPSHRILRLGNAIRSSIRAVSRGETMVWVGWGSNPQPTP